VPKHFFFLFSLQHKVTHPVLGSCIRVNDADRARFNKLKEVLQTETSDAALREDRLIGFFVALNNKIFRVLEQVCHPSRRGRKRKNKKKEEKKQIILRSFFHTCCSVCLSLLCWVQAASSNSSLTRNDICEMGLHPRLDKVVNSSIFHHHHRCHHLLRLLQHFA
jgi:hypothetical protein